MGADGGLKLFAMKGTESTLNQAGSKLLMIVLASSAAGKDNLKSLVSSWLEDLLNFPGPLNTPLKAIGLSAG